MVYGLCRTAANVLMSSMSELLKFLGQLEQAGVHYTLEHNRGEAIMVLVAIPGERWEVEFFESGEVEVEVFRSEGVEAGEESMERLLKRVTEESAL